MKKKGFTLIELLAVIAILAILVIVAVPNIMSMYKKAKSDTFITQAKNIFKTAENTFMSDQLGATAGAKTYCKGTSGTATPLDISGNKNVMYKIVFDASGNVTSFQILDGTTYSITDSTGPVLITDITAVDGSAVTTLVCP